MIIIKPDHLGIFDSKYIMSAYFSNLPSLGDQDKIVSFKELYKADDSKGIFYPFSKVVAVCVDFIEVLAHRYID